MTIKFCEMYIYLGIMFSSDDTTGMQRIFFPLRIAKKIDLCKDTVRRLFQRVVENW